MPRPSVFACFLCPQSGEILLVHQQNGKWSLPGGRRFASESAMTALRREVREETSFEIPGDARPECSWQIRRRWRKRGRDAEVFLYRHRPAVTPAAEIDAIGWFALDSLPMDVSRTVLAAVRACLRLTEVEIAKVA